MHSQTNVNDPQLLITMLSGLDRMLQNIENQLGSQSQRWENVEIQMKNQSERMDCIEKSYLK